MEEKEVVATRLIGDKAPDLKAGTTQGEINFPAD